MEPFSYTKPTDLGAALTALRDADARPLAGGTELINWMRDGIDSPRTVVDITALALRSVQTSAHGLRIGALATMSDVARDPVVRRDYPVLVQSLELAASPQVRNLATIGGNLLQRTRCPYFRSETPVPCNKRAPGSGCAARHGENRLHAIFGWSDSCVATHPSDLAVALMALDASVHVTSDIGARAIPMAELYDLERETTLRHGELITEIEIPATASTATSCYLKVRERTSFEFALVSAAVTLDLDRGTIQSARIALGGVAHKPWRLTSAERALAGARVSTEAMSHAVEGAFSDARPLQHNAFKIPLAKHAIVRALEHAGGVA
jgi:xanthine dehydrogenase YagS FAD-binding subunit